MNPHVALFRFRFQNCRWIVTYFDKLNFPWRTAQLCHHISACDRLVREIVIMIISGPELIPHNTVPEKMSPVFHTHPVRNVSVAHFQGRFTWPTFVTIHLRFWNLIQNWAAWGFKSCWLAWSNISFWPFLLNKQAWNSIFKMLPCHSEAIIAELQKLFTVYAWLKTWQKCALEYLSWARF